MTLKKFLINLIAFYQRRLSPLLGQHCVFLPSCSEYAKAAIEKYGAWKGSWLSFSRILRCHPWQKKRFDPVP